MGSLTMTLTANTLLSLLSLLSLLATLTAHPGGYWWMGQDGAFGSQTDNNKIVDNSPSPSLSPSPSVNDAGVGYYGNTNQPTEDFSSSSSSAPTESLHVGVPASRMLTVSTTLSAALMAAPTSALVEVLSRVIPDHRPTPARPHLLQSTSRRTLQRTFPPTSPPTFPPTR